MEQLLPAGTDHVRIGSTGGTGGILYRPAGDPVDPEDRQTFL